MTVKKDQNKQMNHTKTVDTAPAVNTTAKFLVSLHHKNAPIISLIVFIALFLLDLFLTTHFTSTSIVFCCILLVLQVLIAVCLDHLNYAGLLGVAAIELLVGIISHNFILVLLCLLLYFAALFVIHILNINGGIKTA